ncbi:MAG: hypothetical protein ROY99_06190 [Ignavibacterium sp.]|jgi:hypothetical protein|nr:hypothetical protein [Ignavibacterium sp.]
MKQVLLNDSHVVDFNYGSVFAKERRNDFSIITKLVIASSFLFAIAVLVF